MCGGDYTLILTRPQRKEMTGDVHQRHRVAGADAEIFRFSYANEATAVKPTKPVLTAHFLPLGD
jgi:hypothetical protein